MSNEPIFKIGICVHLFWKNTTSPAAVFLAAPGVFVQTSLQTESLFQTCLKICQDMCSNLPQIRVFKNSGFSQGHKIPLLERQDATTALDNNTRGVQACVTNQIYSPRQALDPRYQIRDQILRKSSKMLAKYDKNKGRHEKTIQERHFLRIKKTT